MGARAMERPGPGLFARDALDRGAGPWVNVQEVTRSAVGELFEKLRAVDVEVSKLEVVLAGKADARALERVEAAERDTGRLEEAIGALRASCVDRDTFSQHVTLSDKLRSLLEKQEQQSKALENNLRVLTESLASKVTADEMKVELSQRPTKKELESALKGKVDAEAVALQLSNKVDISTANEKLLGKVDKTTLNEQLQDKVKRQDFAMTLEGYSTKQEMKSQISKAFNRTQEALDKDIRQIKEQLSNTVTTQQLEQELSNYVRVEDNKSLLSKSSKVISSLSELVTQQTLEKTANLLSKSFEENERQLKNKVEEEMALRQKNMMEEIKEALNKCTSLANLLQTSSSSCFELYKNKEGEINSAIDAVSEGISEVSGRINEVDALMMKVRALLSEEKLENQIGDAVEANLKGPLDELHIVQNMVVGTQRTNNELYKSMTDEYHASLLKLSERVDSLTSEVATLSKEIDRKISIEDFCAIMDTKPSLDDVNKALSEVSVQMSKRVTYDELKEIKKQQDLINDAIADEITLARWLWVKGELLMNGVVNWDVECANSAPRNFTKKRGTIEVNEAGVYEISFGFYGKRRPTIQLIVNSDAVLSVIDAPANTVHHVPRSRGTTGVTGQTHLDYISLPKCSKIQVRLSNGDMGQQGFLQLRKM